MSVFAASGTVTIESPSSVKDEYDDDKESWTKKEAGVVSHIAERSRTTFDQTNGRWLTVRYYEALLPGRSYVDRGWRIQDEQTQEYFQVDHVHKPRNIVYPGAVVYVEMSKIE